MNNIVWFQHISLQDLPEVGGKNASLGEMIQNLTQLGIQVPGGYATTATAFKNFIAQEHLAEKIFSELDQLDVSDVTTLSKVGSRIRSWIEGQPFEKNFEQDVIQAYQQLCARYAEPISVAVRSSATAEDLPTASFAGQQETLLNISGEVELLKAIKTVFASLFNDRAISYRVHQGFTHQEVALSVGIQKMVRSDLAASGVIFSIDTESGFENVVFITAAYGLGEAVVQGTINPDEFYIHKPTLAKGFSPILRKQLGSKAKKMVYVTEQNSQLPASKKAAVTVGMIPVSEADQLQFSITNDEILHLAKQAMIIEQHYQRPMDIEWGKDGLDGQLYILQARPETVQSQRTNQIIERFVLSQRGPILVEGRSVGQKIGQGSAKIIHSITEMHKINPGDVLVADMTDPDWEPIMQRASAIVTNRGGRTCHAAIIARELGIPAIVGCTDATEKIQNDTPITVSCAEGDTGFVYAGKLRFELMQTNVETMPEIPVNIMMNVANPDRAFDLQRLPNEGVGLARVEFIINQMIRFHPKALLNFMNLTPDLQEQIHKATCAYQTPKQYYIHKLAEGIAMIAAAFYPKPVIVRLSDFKSNEYANLIGGKSFEAIEENPMLGFRGASRYVDQSFQPCFQMECQAVKIVRETMGLTNVQVMIPFVRTVTEAGQVIQLLQANGLKRGTQNLKIIMMCEIPSNALLAEEFLQYFDGFSIGSNDMTQLTLGLDRDSALIAESFDERNPAVKKLLHMAISTCRNNNKYIGICGQGPSDHPDFAEWLLSEKIESISLNPDSVIETWLRLSKQSHQIPLST